MQHIYMDTLFLFKSKRKRCIKHIWHNSMRWLRSVDTLQNGAIGWHGGEELLNKFIFVFFAYKMKSRSFEIDILIYHLTPCITRQCKLCYTLFTVAVFMGFFFVLADWTSLWSNSVWKLSVCHQLWQRQHAAQNQCDQSQPIQQLWLPGGDTRG